MAYRFSSKQEREFRTHGAFQSVSSHTLLLLVSGEYLWTDIQLTNVWHQLDQCLASTGKSKSTHSAFAYKSRTALTVLFQTQRLCLIRTQQAPAQRSTRVVFVLQPF